MERVVKESRHRLKQAHNTWLKLDFFPRRVPQLTMRGKESKPTAIGSICSILVVATILTYGILQLQKLVDRKNPRISSSTETFALGSTDKLNLQQAGLHIAFTAETLWYEPLDDPKYVKFMVRLYGFKDDIE